MSDSEKAAKVMEALKAAEREPTQIALPILNGIVGLVQGDHEQRLEVEEARSSAFLAICEVGKALHRGQPEDGLWAVAISATERWMALVVSRWLRVGLVALRQTFVCRCHGGLGSSRACGVLAIQNMTAGRLSSVRLPPSRTCCFAPNICSSLPWWLGFIPGLTGNGQSEHDGGAVRMET